MKKYLLFGLIIAAQSSYASLVLTSPIAVTGTGLGAEPTLLTLQSQGSATTETGCVGSTAALIGNAVSTTGACSGSTLDVMTGASQIGPQSLAAGGVTTADTFGIVFNAAEPAGNSITLTGLTASFYSSTGAFLYQTSGFSCPGITGPCTFPSTNTGAGKSGFLFTLDAGQQAAANAAGVFTSSSNLVGLFASAADATGGLDTFYLAAVPPAGGGGGGGGGGVVPEPGTVFMMAAGIGLVAFGAIRRKSTNQ